VYLNRPRGFSLCLTQSKKIIIILKKKSVCISVSSLDEKNG
jgi:hypothetical protein